MWYSPADVADIFDTDEALVLKLLTNEKARLSFFPGAFEIGTSWHIPEADLKRMIGAPVENLMRVSTFARVVDRDGDTIRAWCNSGKLKSIVIDGQHHIPVSEYWRLRGENPPRRARLSFFCERVADSKGEAR